MRFAQLALASLFAGAAMAAPAPAPVAEVAAPAEDANVLAKRGEGIHLVNCYKNSRAVYSAVVYCPNDSNCNFNPGPGNSCVPGGTIVWERPNGSCRFGGTGVTFSWGIASNAQSFPNYQQVGDGGNGGTHFRIFKDDNHRMYTDGNGNSCQSLYYGVP